MISARGGTAGELSAGGTGSVAGTDPEQGADAGTVGEAGKGASGNGPSGDAGAAEGGNNGAAGEGGNGGAVAGGGTGGSDELPSGGRTGTAGTAAGSGGSGLAGTGGKGGSAGTTPTAGTGSPAGGTGTSGTSSAGTSSAGTSSAGTSSAGGSSVDCGTTFAIGSDGFVRAPAVGGACWHGYASAGGDDGSTVMPNAFAVCGRGCMLNARGTVGPANMTNGYAGNVYIGFNVNQSGGSKTTVTPTGSGAALSVSELQLVAREFHDDPRQPSRWRGGRACHHFDDSPTGAL